MSITTRWILLGAVIAGAFAVLGFFGREVYRSAPPIPDRVVAEDGSLLATQDDILTGQQVWQSIGGQQIGSIWGHGAYQAPDWSADWLHREATALLDLWAEREHGSAFDALPAEAKGALRARLVAEMRANRFDAATGVFAGGCGLNQLNPLHGYCNLGYWVRASQQRRGAAMQAIQTLSRFGFEELKLGRIEIAVAVGNVASLGAARKAGALEEGIARNRLRLGERFVDAHVLSLIAPRSP